MISGLLKPEYLWRPSQVWRRLSFKPSEDVVSLALPWNCSISSSPVDAIGHAIATQGVYDLPLTEALLRLTDSGDIALDVGANIGYCSLALAMSSGQLGRVTCFEPNPRLLPTLRMNVERWRSLDAAPIQIQTMALSDRNGEATLGYPEDYSANHGLARLGANRQGVQVGVRRLDSLEMDCPAVMKVDVEGHEAAVFTGAEKLLARRAIRDILFEEHEPYPAASHKVLAQHGYHLFRLTRSTWRPLLLPPMSPARQAYLPANYLGTTDPSRAQARFRRWGWLALSNPRWRRPNHSGNHSTARNGRG